MRRTWLWALAGLLGAGCSAPVTELRLDEVELDYGFVVTANARDELVRILDPTIVRRTGALPVDELRPEEVRFFLIALTDAELAEHAPGFVVGRAAELTARLEAPPPKRTYLFRDSAQPQRIVRAFPEEVRVFVGEIRGGELRTGDLSQSTVAGQALGGRLTLVAPVLAEYCRRASQTRLVHFGAAPKPLESIRRGHERLRTVDLDWVDDEKVILTSFHLVGLVTRNKTLPRLPRRADREERPYISLFELGVDVRQGERFEGAIVTDNVVEWRREVIFYGGRPPDKTMTATVSSGFVQRAWLGEEGFVLGEFERYEAFHINEGVWTRDHGAVLGAEFGRLLRRDDEQWPFEVWHQLPTIDAFDPQDPDVSDSVWSMLAPERDGRSLVVTTEGRVHSLRDEAWSYEEIRQGVVLGPELYKFFSIGEGLTVGGRSDIWVGSQVGDLWRVPGDGGPPEEWAPFLPVGFSACAGQVPDDGRLEIGRRAYTTMATADDTLFLGLERCVGLAQVHLGGPAADDRCATIVGTTDVHRTEAPEESYGAVEAAASRGNAVAVTTGLGELFITEW